MNHPALGGEVSKDNMARIQNKKQAINTNQNYKLNLVEQSNSSLGLKVEVSLLLM